MIARPNTVAFVPTLLPGETVFSWCSRYHRLSGAASSADTCRQLFQHRYHGSQHDIPSRVRRLAHATGFLLGPDLQLLNEHTLFGYYTCLRDSSDRDLLVRRITSDNPRNIKYGLGVTAGKFGAIHPLRSCDACIELDTAEHGVAYWHIEHQYPGVLVCHRHGLWLDELAVDASRRAARGWILPAESARQSSDLAAPVLRCAGDFARYTVQFIKARFARPLALRELRSVLLEELVIRGMVRPGGRLNVPALSRLVITDAQELARLPQLAAVPATRPTVASMLRRLLLPHCEMPHPIRVLLLLRSIWPCETRLEEALRKGRAPVEPAALDVRLEQQSTNGHPNAVDPADSAPSFRLPRHRPRVRG
jgi:hypothetical protein